MNALIFLVPEDIVDVRPRLVSFTSASAVRRRSTRRRHGIRRGTTVLLIATLFTALLMNVLDPHICWKLDGA